GFGRDGIEHWGDHATPTAALHFLEHQHLTFSIFSKDDSLLLRIPGVHLNAFNAFSDSHPVGLGVALIPYAELDFRPIIKIPRKFKSFVQTTLGGNWLRRI